MKRLLGLGWPIFSKQLVELVNESSTSQRRKLRAGKVQRCDLQSGKAKRRQLPSVEQPYPPRIIDAWKPSFDQLPQIAIDSRSRLVGFRHQLRNAEPSLCFADCVQKLPLASKPCLSSHDPAI